VLPIHVFKPFTPEVLEGMDWAFKAAIKIIEEEEAGPASDMTREAVALHIVDAAQRGVRGREELRESALAYWRSLQKAVPTPGRGEEGSSAASAE
jgi:hypothetical protein